MLKKKLPGPPLDRSLIHQHSFSKRDLQDCGAGKLFGPGRAQLPINKMLMFDRILNITEDGGKYGKGKIIADLDIHHLIWFFHSHFFADLLMHCCLVLEAL